MSLQEDYENDRSFSGTFEAFKHVVFVHRVTLVVIIVLELIVGFSIVYYFRPHTVVTPAPVVCGVNGDYSSPGCEGSRVEDPQD